MSRLSVTTGILGSIAALSAVFFRMDMHGAVWLPGTVALLLGAVSIFLSSREPGGSILPGASALLLYAGFFLLPLLAESLSGFRGIAFLFVPLLACLLLTGMLTYFGIHVLSRGVIFVDLALAQVASLGAVLAFASGVTLQTTGSYLYSLAFALVGAFIFAMSRQREGRVPQEAIIGIVYAVATAVGMLLVDKNPEGLEVIQGALTGRLMWVDSGSIVTTARLYAVVGVFHLLLFGKFLMISRDPARAARSGINLRLWDLFFYLSFGVVITKSVEMSGILLVFAFLVIPAVISSLFLESLGKRLGAGWVLGSGASVIGLVLSYRYDLSSGPAIVSVLTLMLLFGGLLFYIMKAKNRRIALVKTAAGLSSVALVFYVLYATSPLSEGITAPHGHVHTLEEEQEAHAHAALDSLGHPEGTQALHLLEHYLLHPDSEIGLADLREHLDELIGLLNDPSPEVREKAASVLGVVGDGPLLEKELERAFTREEDWWVRFEIACSLFGLDRKKGGKFLLEIMSDDTSPTFLKNRSAELLRDATGVGFGFIPEASREANRNALEQWSDFLENF